MAGHKNDPSSLTKVDLANHKGTWAVQLACKLTIIAAILTAIGFGGSSKVFSLKTKEFLGSTIDADLQLAFLGLINKIMDLLLTKALQVTAGVIITLKMTHGKRSGARLVDFELAEELTKPWVALSKFQGRWSYFGWKKAEWLRFSVALPVSVCVLLQGLAINTIGVPKERWYPEEGHEENVTHPTAHFQGFNWENSWDAAWRTVGEGDVSWRVAGGYIASSTNLAFQNFAWQMALEPCGWRQLGVSNDEYPALDTCYNSATSRGVAIHGDQVMQVFRWMQENGTANARRAIGIHGDMKVTSPSTSVSCNSLNNSRVPEVSEQADASIVVGSPDNSPGASTAFSVHLPPAAASNFSGATCDVEFRRVRFPVNIWNIGGASTASASVNMYDQKFDIEPEVLPPTPIDKVIAGALATQTQATTSRLENIVEDMTCAQWLMEISREVHKRRAEYKSDIEALAPTVALLTTQLLAAALWNVTYPEEEGQQVESTMIRWQLFGSGPRLPWAWASVAILGILVLSLSASVALSFWHMIVPGEWLKAGGMLVAANSSPSMLKLQDSLGKPRRELEGLRFGVRQSNQSGGVDIVNASGATNAIDASGTYEWAK